MPSREISSENVNALLIPGKQCKTHKDTYTDRESQLSIQRCDLFFRSISEYLDRTCIPLTTHIGLIPNVSHSGKCFYPSR